MTHNNISSHHQTFESIRQKDSENNEFWLARQLFKILEYSEYRSFLAVIDKAKKACENSGHIIKDHFGDITEMVDRGTAFLAS